ncbi:AMP-binding protein [Picosynechococcus sp. PCC 7003]|uniref:fatty acyl-AMP ligase n=1 Tax=Picosynechococcus sp. PCC 7003 TaxID=374981 RepID=UPI0008104CA3|nr:fatty acyl-AMP ligase [Picosynechococcus sp. PCC 7003]ANV84454.1 AMP-binding protein [Picosynechococcus sp. PCC 7003]
MTHSAKTIVDLLHHHADASPDRTAYYFIAGEDNLTQLTYAQLEQQVKAIAAHLQTFIEPGDRILLVFPYSAGLEFVASFYGCLYAGAIAVTINPSRSDDALDKLMERVEDCQAKAILTTQSLIEYFQKKLIKAPIKAAGLTQKFSQVKAIAMDKIPLTLAADWQPPQITEETLAFLQYTSGSTGKPKGVMVTHGNVLHNSATIYKSFSHSPESKMASWLPMFHDMGLIGGLIQPLYGGFPSYLMSPIELIQKPVRWLEVISQHRITTSGGPNFAYDLVANQVTPKQLESLDLNSWDVAYSGAETVRASTLEKFAQTFAPCGFRKEAFYPCYGMAEATLFISGGSKGIPPVVQYVAPEALEQNQAIISTDGRRGIVSCGWTWLGDEVVIVDPETNTKLPEGQVGEIWAAGKGIGKGYWERPEITKETFQAYVDGQGPYLRTGDLGFLKDGELFVTGRIKDVMILWGRYRYPQDIELTVEQCHPALRPCAGAAFSIEAADEERLVVVQELKRSYVRKFDLAEVVGAIRQAVYQEHTVEVYGIVLLRTGSILKTSSGKIQRRACRQAFLEGNLNSLGEWILHETHDIANLISSF